MAVGATLLLINHPQEDLPAPRALASETNILHVITHAEAWSAGVKGLGVHSLSVVQNGQATGTLTLSTASGTVGGTINGVTVTVTAAGGDTATAVLIAAAINASANALVSNHVTATSALGVVTLTSKYPGHAGNAVTLAASGTGVTASGARLTGGTNGNGGAQ
jgi:phage tail sheath gpL-like